MKSFRPSRRRFIGIMAACAAVASSPWSMRQAMGAGTPAAGIPTGGPAAGDPAAVDSLDVVSWRGIALGADAELHIYHPDRAFAQKLIERSIAEVQRLERVFSLYRDDSMLVRLNRDGRLDKAPTDMLRLLQESQGYSRMTAGAFDPTVQPLWKLYADASMTWEARRRAAATSGNAESGPFAAGMTKFGLMARAPSLDDIARVLRLVDYRAIEIDGRSIRLAHQGMALTLNGIAQGYITDRVTELLLDAGLQYALVDMGEIRGTDGAPGGRPWRVGLAGDRDDGKPMQVVEMRDRALSTSSGNGTMFDADGAMTHLFDPRTGAAKPRYRSVSVMAGTATAADAMSTAFSLMEEGEIRQISNVMKLQVWLLRQGATQLARLD